MKKLLAMLCMITCIFGLTACGGEKEAVSEQASYKAQVAESLAEQAIVPIYSNLIESGESEAVLEEYTAEEIAYVMELSVSSLAQQYDFAEVTFDGAGAVGSINSFASAFETMGAIVEYGTPKTVEKDNELIVTFPVTGEKKEGSVEVIFSTKKFLSVESCTLNVNLSLGEMMGKAGLNTLLGMGTVFCVLILIMAIISAFGIIPKIQKKAADKKAGKKEAAETPATAATPVVETAAENLTDDLELVAVIAAAIAASEGAASTDGFVVRSIRRARRR